MSNSVCMDYSTVRLVASMGMIRMFSVSRISRRIS